MRVELISTGTELLLGEIINTSAVYLSEELNQLGYSVLFQTTVGDNEERLKEVYSIALERSDIVITTGGLGPTEGDITKHVMADLLDQELVLDAPSLAKIEEMFARRNAVMSKNNIRQAMVPKSATPLENNYGTAPGIWMETDRGKLVIQLPGPPYEMRKMFKEQVEHRLREKYGVLGEIYSMSLQTIGISESVLAETLNDLIVSQTNPTIALLSNSHNQGIRVRLTAKGKSHEEAQEITEVLEREIRSRLQSFIWGVDNEDLAGKVGQLLRKRKETLAVAESCTGGFLGYRLTSQSGSSDYFSGGTICYSNAAKIRDCGVSSKSLAQNGAVSPEVAVEMSQGIAEHFESDWGIGITGVAGPTGGTEEKPVGLVYISIWHRTWKEAKVESFVFNGERDQVRRRSAQNALFMLFSELGGMNHD